jgi:hypothetical protein
LLVTGYGHGAVDFFDALSHTIKGMQHAQS